MGAAAALAVWDCSDVELDDAGLPRLERGVEPRCVAVALGTRLTILDEAVEA